MSAATEDLERFVRDALARGESRAAIEAALASAGWPQEQVREALDAYADVPFAVPVPRPRPYLSAREAFLYLVMFASLYVWAVQLGNLLFDLVNHWLPDPADPQWQVQWQGRSMRWAVASILIAFPLFLYVSRLLSREMAGSPVKRLSVVRRWLTYMTLFLAAGVLVGDLITLVFNLLGGALTLRFVLKVAIVGAIAGAIFWFYLRERFGRELAIIAAVVVAATLAAAFMVMRSPADERAVTLDQRRVQDLQMIGHAVEAWYQVHDALPPDLASAAKQPGSTVPTADPATGATYEYIAGAGRDYRLCAAFATDTSRTGASEGQASPDAPRWDHPAGRHCFDREVVARGTR
jgi:hypothetical protein